MPNSIQEIYVRLLDEGTEVWRPVKAKEVKTSPHTFQILEQEYCTADEKWEFKPGDMVRVEVRALSGGQCLVAVLKIASAGDQG